MTNPWFPCTACPLSLQKAWKTSLVDSRTHMGCDRPRQRSKVKVIDGICMKTDINHAFLTNHNFLNRLTCFHKYIPLVQQEVVTTQRN